MNTRFIRVYQNLDVNVLKEHLLIYGEISGNCANCQTIDIKLDSPSCPQCHSEFKYIAFRNIRSHLAKLSRLLAERPFLTFVDYEDFAKNLAAQKAKDFLA
jgi:hypothetical protein